jgi:hypothetical protein
MVRISAFGRALRPAVMVVLGAVIGAGATPAIAALHGPGATVTQTRSFSCPGRNFHPVDSGINYAMTGNEIVQSVGDSNGAWPFVCQVDLPNNALVTKVQFTVLANSLTGATLDDCGLFRSGLATTTAQTTQPIGVLATIGSNAGLVRRTTTTISHATVDTMNYAYWLQCVMGVTSSYAHDNVGIFGADIVYRISSANG